MNTNTIKKKKQIKGENQLTDLAKTVVFLWEKLHKYKADRKLKDDVIKILCGQVLVLQGDLD